VTTTDLYSTIAGLAGHVGPLPSNVEGANLVPVLMNGGVLPDGMDHLSRNFHEGGEVYFHWPMNFGGFNRTKPSSAVRDGDFKFYLEYAENGGDDKLFLYNLATDIGESVNLASSMPEKVAELRAKMDRYFESIDASFAFDVKDNITLQWDASAPGAELNRWRSTIKVGNKPAEMWTLGAETKEPQRQSIETHQPGLPDHAFHFDGDDAMDRLFFQVGDDGPRKVVLNPGTPDWDRSASMEFWVRLDSIVNGQVLFESGNDTSGISASLGDADSDGKTNDLRFRILGLTGPNGGLGGVLNSLTVTAPIDRFADPQGDFVHIVTVFNDDPNDRYGEIYVNGALAAHVDGLTGVEQSLQWDGYDNSGLGNVGGNGIGGNGGSGDLPFSGGFRGQMALFRFRNHVVSASTILDSYNSVLEPVDYGIHSVAGSALVPVIRPANVSLDAHESASLMVVEERTDVLGVGLDVDAVIGGPITLDAIESGTAGALTAGTLFTSYLLQFDPANNNGAVTESVTGSVQFSQEILAILFDSASLADSDALLGAIGDYGIEADRGMLLSGGDFLTISSDRRTLEFDLSIPGDELLQFRVVTDQVQSADFDKNWFVNSADLAIWEAAYGISDLADADLDGQTTGLDFLIWQRQAQGGNPLSVSTAVPEPATWLLAVGLLPLLGWSRG
jgi:hypothetical protein